MLTRRGLFGLAVVGMLGACAPAGPPGPTPPGGYFSPRPSLSDARAGMDEALRLTGLVDALLARRDLDRLSAGQVNALRWARAAQAAHIAVLAAADSSPTPALPAEPSATPAPSTTPSAGSTPGPAPAPGWAKLQAALRDVAAADLRRAKATLGPTCLLWTSLGAYASAAARSIASGPAQLVPAPAKLTSAAIAQSDALADAVRGAHEVVFAFGIALTTFRKHGPGYDPMLNALLGWRGWRDQLAELMRSVNLEPPVAEPFYRVDVPRSQSASRALCARVEAAYLPHLGRLVASSADTALRDLAIGKLTSTAGSTAGWGGGLHVWPGWPGA